MCVIMLADSSRLTEEMVDLGYEANKDGAGIAWREEGLVKWRKGLNLSEMQDLCRELPLPYCAHFRIQTCGGVVPALCHPFPISEGAELALAGTTDGEVLFHNGHWTSWKQMMYDVASRKNLKLPPGKWSDTRGMAWMAHALGLGVLEMIGEKALAFGPKEIDIYGNWDVENDCWVSNTHWKRKEWTHLGTHRAAGFRQANDDYYGSYLPGAGSSISPQDRTKPRELPPLPPLKQVGGPATEATFRAGEEGVAGGKDIKEGVKAGEEAGREGKEAGPSDDATGSSEAPHGRGNDASLILLPNEEEIGDILWVRSLNPKRRRSYPRQVIDVDTQRETRTAAAASGTQIIGPL